MADDDVDGGSLEAVGELASRVQRIQFYLNAGDSGLSDEAADAKAEPAYPRLQAVQRSLRGLCAKHSTTQTLLDLQKNHPELFPQDGPPSLDTAEQLATLKAYANAIPIFVSQLNLTQDLGVPPLESFNALAALRPRLSQVERDYESLAAEVAELRLRSAAILQRWYETTVLAGGDCWVQWEERLDAIERAVRRREVLKQAEESDI